MIQKVLGKPYLQGPEVEIGRGLQESSGESLTHISCKFGEIDKQKRFTILTVRYAGV